MRLLMPALCFLILTSCNKSGKKDETNPPPPSTATLSLSVTEATPGDAVEIKVNKNNLANEVTIALGSTTQKAYVKGDSAYVFIVPVISPGSVTVSIPSIAGSNTMSLKIAAYTPVPDPQLIINDFIEKRNKSIDSIAKPPSISGFQPSPATITLLNQLKEEMDLQLIQLSASEKELLSYVMQKNKPDPTAFTQDLLAPSYYAKLSGTQGDVGDKLVAIAKSYVTVQGVCLSTIPIMVASGVALLVAPNPFAAAVFVGAFTTFVISRENAIRRAQEVGRLKGVAEAITDGDAQKLMAVGFTNNQEKTLSMSVSFRNLAATDAGINADVATAFTSEQSFVNKDKEIESLYGKIKTGSWFTKLAAAYTSYVSVIGKVPQATTTLPVDGNNIVVKGVSDNRINYTTSLSGTSRKVKITSTATEEISFNLKLAYVRTLDGKEITKDIACIFSSARSGITVAGGNGYGSAANQFDYPFGVSVDASGNIYIADEANHRVQKWAPGASSGITVAGGNGSGSDANQLDAPKGVFADASGNVYIADYYNRRIQKWAPGASSGVTVAGGNGKGPAANQLDDPQDVFVDGSGNIYVADLFNHRIQKWTKGASSGITVAGGNGYGSNANQLYNPSSIFVDASGNIYIADQANNRIQKWAPGASSGITVAGGNGQGSDLDQLDHPSGVCVDANGNIYIADEGNHRIQKWVPGASSGVTVAGGNGYGPAANQIWGPRDVSLDASRNIYIADYSNHRIQKWSPY